MSRTLVDSVRRKPAGNGLGSASACPERGRQKGETGMPAYVSLLNWTDQGIKNFRQSTERAKEFTKLVEASGGTVRELVWTVGEYDLVTVIDYPDEESAVAASLKLGAAGNIRSNTMRAFSASEMERIIARTS